MLTLEQEQQVLQQILSGDKERYALIVKEYQETVANLCYKLVGNKLDVEEITQQVFVELYTALPRLSASRKLIHSGVRNTVCRLLASLSACSNSALFASVTRVICFSFPA